MPAPISRIMAAQAERSDPAKRARREILDPNAPAMIGANEMLSRAGTLREPQPVSSPRASETRPDEEMNRVRREAERDPQRSVRAASRHLTQESANVL